MSLSLCVCVSVPLIHVWVQAVRQLERELHTAQTTRGEASEELKATYERTLKSHERLLAGLQRSVLGHPGTYAGPSGRPQSCVCVCVCVCVSVMRCC
jgi:hypothetical protein